MNFLEVLGHLIYTFTTADIINFRVVFMKLAF